MASRRGAWYLLGHDVDKGEPRMFKLSRIDAEATPIGKPGSYPLPAAVDFEGAWRRLEPSTGDEVAIVALRAGRAPDLRRRGEVTGSEAPAGYEAYRFTYARRGDFVAELCAHGADAVVLEPASLREAAIDHLRAVAGGSR
ncbi:MAG: WYL domain-containing protein [Propionibacteriales bacterium]|nr:WYL domain-containing protein [Propionibacteriales bacterium]